MSVSAEKYTKNVYQIKIPLKYIRENWRFCCCCLFLSHKKICNFIETQKSNLTVCIKYEDCKAFLIINKPITGWNTNITKNNTDHCVNDAKKKLCERMDSRKYMSKWNQIPNFILTRIHYTTMNQCKPKTKQ